MNTARFATGKSSNEGIQIVTINADCKSDAQAAIKLAQAWIKASGMKSKLVSFVERTSEYSNLVKYYSARIAYK